MKILYSIILLISFFVLNGCMHKDTDNQTSQTNDLSTGENQQETVNDRKNKDQKNDNDDNNGKENDDINVSEENNENSGDNKSVKNEEQNKNDTSGGYDGELVGYSKDKLNSDKQNVLFFSAQWCPTCQAAKENFKESGIPKNINMLKVDYDTANELKKKYGVTIQHTFVYVDEDGNKIGSWQGGTTIEQIKEELNSIKS